jgi:hypothetical protein
MGQINPLKMRDLERILREQQEQVVHRRRSARPTHPRGEVDAWQQLMRSKQGWALCPPIPPEKGECLFQNGVATGER